MRHPTDDAAEPGGSSGERAVYVISVAAELAGVHPQTLRIYDRKGLLSPERTAGNTRRYSERDIDRLRMIQVLTQEDGINLAGVKRIMEMERELRELRDRLAELEARLAVRRPIEAPGRRATNALVPLQSVVRFAWQERA